MNERIDVSRWSDAELERGFAQRVRRDRVLTAEVLIFLGEMIARRLFGPAGYSSMYQYCVRRCGMSADVAFKWTRAARVARRFPVVLDMVEDGRLHLTAITMIAPRLEASTAPWLLPAAASKSTRELRLLLASHWPQPDAPTVIKPIAARREAPAVGQCNEPPAVGGERATEPETSTQSQELAAQPVLFSDTDARQQGESSPPAVSTAPTARYLLQCTLDEEAVELLERARSLAAPGAAAEVTAVLKAALRDHVEQQEKRKFAATERPRSTGRPHAGGASRGIPAHVKREVWMRDEGRCTFVGVDGTCCGTREALEFDHILPVARGGESTTANVRLRCRTHNQVEADRVFGRAFMDRKRESAPDARV